MCIADSGLLEALLCRCAPLVCRWWSLWGRTLRCAGAVRKLYPLEIPHPTPQVGNRRLGPKSLGNTNAKGAKGNFYKVPKLNHLQERLLDQAQARAP